MIGTKTRGIEQGEHGAEVCVQRLFGPPLGSARGRRWRQKRETERGLRRDADDGAEAVEGAAAHADQRRPVNRRIVAAGAPHGGDGGDPAVGCRGSASRIERTERPLALSPIRVGLNGPEEYPVPSAQ